MSDKTTSTTKSKEVDPSEEHSVASTKMPSVKVGDIVLYVLHRKRVLSSSVIRPAIVTHVFSDCVNLTVFADPSDLRYVNAPATMQVTNVPYDKKEKSARTWHTE